MQGGLSAATGMYFTLKPMATPPIKTQLGYYQTQYGYQNHYC